MPCDQRSGTIGSMTTPHENFESFETAPVPEEQPVAQPQQPVKKGPSVAAGTWAFLIIGALLLILLLVFILQNQQQVEVNLFNFSWQFPAGVAYLISAIIGALITALVGGWRMIDIRRQIRKSETH